MADTPQKQNITGLYHSVTLLIVIGVIMYGAKICHIPDPTWALISGVVCTELEIEQARSVILSRIFATIIGVTLACITLLIIGPGYLGIMVCILITALICHYGIPIKNAWKLATATSIIVLISGLKQHSVYFAETMALTRASEVIGGSIIAGIISILSGKLLLILENKM